MSFDLYFTGRQITQDEFQNYFYGRGGYLLSDKEAWYQNNHTGVYFSFSWSDAPDEQGSTLAFNLNLFRPHIFGLEAEPELTAVAAHFGFTVFDPQGDGVGSSTFSAESFLKNWNQSNEFGYQSILQSENGPSQLWTLPTEQIEAYWRWNFQKEAMQKQVGDELFIPSIMFMNLGDQLSSAAVFPPGVFTLVPQVDQVVVALGENPERPELRLLPWGKLAELMERPPRPEWVLPGYELHQEKLPQVLTDYLASRPQEKERPEGVPVDKILNAELVEKYSGNRPA